MEHDGQQLQHYLTGEEFKINVPSASRMGGDWERQIRSVKICCFFQKWSIINLISIIKGLNMFV